MNIISLIDRYSGNVRTRKESQITRLVIHHDAGRRPDDKAKVIPRFDAYDRQHDDNGGFPYHYAIDPWGRVYKCRKTTEVTAHVRNANTPSLAVMLMGYFHKDANYKGERPTAAQLKSLKALVVEIRAAIPSIVEVIPHRRVAGSKTACPGNLFPYEIFAEAPML